MIVVDTSVWIEALRGGGLARHFDDLLEADEVAVPAPVRVEVLMGMSRQHLPDAIDGFNGVTSLVPTARTWERVETWLVEAVRSGQRFGVVDLLIAATAVEQSARVWSLDADFLRMQKLGFVELYAAPS